MFSVPMSILATAESGERTKIRLSICAAAVLARRSYPDVLVADICLVVLPEVGCGAAWRPHDSSLSVDSLTLYHAMTFC